MMREDNTRLASTIVKAIEKSFSEFSDEYPNLKFVLIDNENNIITDVSCNGALVEFRMLANDGSEYLKLRSPNDISVKIKPTKRSIGLT